MFAKVKRWGNSLGMIVPSEVARTHGLRDGDLIEVEFKKRIPTVEEVGGTLTLRTNLKSLLREMEEGWDDR